MEGYSHGIYYWITKIQVVEVIRVVIDRFSRYGHFIALSHPISAKGLAQVFFEQIYRLHGLPKMIFFL